MADASSVNVAEVVNSLEKFSNNVRIKVTKVATRRSSKLVKEKMKALAPRGESGALAEGVTARTKTDVAGGRAYSVIGPFGKVMSVDQSGIGKKVSQAYKGRFMEYGTKHTSKQPFIQKALDQTRSLVEQEYASVVDRELKKL
ncbi:HK97-gp10 family putative phage morphogenesis protein [Aliamphritea ceti]|uniref:HK97-gp10 family putative phage morphogenesis protein n=1 Tax=Aliamphritea ceti TaxID=1524258 RepID=UPI0021C3C81C|nr:HK97-gp10 family putative phage morphogenesis protein [Aliamphritea ceti]